MAVLTIPNKNDKDLSPQFLTHGAMVVRNPTRNLPSGHGDAMVVGFATWTMEFSWHAGTPIKIIQFRLGFWNCLSIHKWGDPQSKSLIQVERWIISWLVVSTPLKNIGQLVWLQASWYHLPITPSDHWSIHSIRWSCACAKDIAAQPPLIALHRAAMRRPQRRGSTSLASWLGHWGDLRATARKCPDDRWKKPFWSWKKGWCSVDHWRQWM